MSATLAIALDFFTSLDFWIGTGVVAATYGIFALGLQLNVGYTGTVNFGQAGFMAIGAYAMAILVVDHQWSFWLALPAAMALAMLAGLLIGLPSLRLRTDYFAIVTIAFAEMIRYTAQNARELTGGNQGLLGFDDTWISVSNTIQDWLEPIGLGEYYLLPLFLVSWALFIGLIVIMTRLQGSPWGRVLRAIREDEDAAAALGKNALSYKLQSLAFAAALGALAGYLLALNLSFLNPQSFEPLFTFIGYAVLVLGGLATYAGVALGAILLWTLLEATRFLDLPLAAEKVAALRFMLVGLVLILLMAFRPQGILGKREEMVLGD
jgi:branched-chain amino acid transport system permease protein